MVRRRTRQKETLSAWLRSSSYSVELHWKMFAARYKPQENISSPPLVDDTEYLRLYYLFKEPPVGFYLVFTNEHLQRIIQPPKAELKRVPYKGTFREIPMQKATTNLIDEVLTARDLTREEISQLIRHALPRSSESLNALPAFMVAAPSFVKGWGEIESDYQTNAELAQKYDPMKVEVGDTVAEVEAAFGSCYRIVESSPGSEIHVFGGPVNLRINPAYKFSSVAVVFENGKVTQVLSHYFFDKQLLNFAESTLSGCMCF